MTASNKEGRVAIAWLMADKFIQISFCEWHTSNSILYCYSKFAVSSAIENNKIKSYVDSSTTYFNTKLWLRSLLQKYPKTMPPV